MKHRQWKGERVVIPYTVESNNFSTTVSSESLHNENIPFHQTEKCEININKHPLTVETRQIAIHKIK